MTTESTPNGKAPTLLRRRLFISANILVQVLAVAAVVVGLNWLVARHYMRFDWTKAGYYSLSDKTRQVLAALPAPLKIVVFLPPSDQREYVEKVLQDVRNLLQEFQFIAGSSLAVEYVDPQRDLARAKQLVEQYSLDSPDVIIFDSGGRHKYVRLDEVVELDYGQFGQGVRVKAFKGEGMFLSAIQTVIEEKPPKLYFLTGHGEHDPDDFDRERGYSELARYIKRDNITIAKWNPLEQQSLPTDSSLLILAGPRQPYTPPELTALDGFLRNKGRLLIMADAHEQTGLASFLRQWGVKLGDDLVVVKGGKLLGTELLLVNALGTQYAPHPITAKLEGVNTSFPYARSVSRLPGPETGQADQPQVTELVKTPAAFWGETNPDTDYAAFDPNTDTRGPLSLAVAVEQGKPPVGGVDIGISRMVVVGSSTFVDNAGLSGGNLDLFMSALNWLLQREQMMAVGPKSPDEFRLDMSPNQVRAVYGLVIGGMPLAVAIIGLVVWMRRRK